MVFVKILLKCHEIVFVSWNNIQYCNSFLYFTVRYSTVLLFETGKLVRWERINCIFNIPYVKIWFGSRTILMNKFFSRTEVQLYKLSSLKFEIKIIQKLRNIGTANTPYTFSKYLLSGEIRWSHCSGYVSNNFWSYTAEIMSVCFYWIFFQTAIVSAKHLQKRLL